MGNMYSLRPTALDELDYRIRQVKIDACLVLRNRRLVYRHYRKPEFEREPHKVNSVTKSVLSLLIGIALERGELPSLGAPLSDFVDGVPPDKRAITLEHLLSMSPGMEWKEAGAWGSLPPPGEHEADWIRFVLDAKMTDPPGKKMIYNSGCSHLLSAVLQKATGMTASAYAGRHLFAPLGIDDWDWPSDRQGISIGGFGLKLRPADLLKIGQLLLAGGCWQRDFVVSREWIETSTLPRLPATGRHGLYGYHWWIDADGAKQETRPRVVFAQGFAGQFLILVPEADIAAVFASDLGTKTLTPLTIFRDTIMNGL